MHIMGQEDLKNNDKFKIVSFTQEFEHVQRKWSWCDLLNDVIFQVECINLYTGESNYQPMKSFFPHLNVVHIS